MDFCTFNKDKHGYDNVLVVIDRFSKHAISIPFQKTSESPAKEPSSKLDPAIQDLVKLIFNQQYFAATMTELNYDVNKLPLGKLSKGTISRGYQALKDLAGLMNNSVLVTSEYGTTYKEAIEQLSNSDYLLIPHAFGRNRPPIISNQDMLLREIQLLDSLGDMKDTAAIMKDDLKDVGTDNQLDKQFEGLNLNEMIPIKRESSEYVELYDYVVKTRGSTHYLNYEVEEIFKIERMANANGIYLADMSSKSANYCNANLSNGHALLLLCEAELGDPMQILTSASYSAGEDAKSKGIWSTWGQGTIGPQNWKDASCVSNELKGVMMPDTNVLPSNTNAKIAHLMYNEYIAYNVAQVKLRYLLRVKM
ncbi:poly adp-ribose polymerase [Calycina marina]|uniref:Poly [ADP-ribose] polymerase n=1 Tax=Calycina marina TaxID=1763456 RepID=A0A9P7Z2S4_9HELO|nr:poly adp-ribose polymerase [Calycina marina]